MRLIDVDAFRDFWNKNYRHQYANDNFLFALANFPTVDAVEVVRCKDCVTHDLCIVEDHLVFAGWENPFCCAGKRKDGDGNG